MFKFDASKHTGRDPFGHKASYAAKPEIFSKGKKCLRLDKGQNYEITKAVSYLKLLDQGCPKKDSMSFCCRRVCKLDSTKTKDGPPSYRTLKIMKNPNAANIKGWLTEGPQYSLGKKEFSFHIKKIMDDKKNEEKSSEPNVENNLTNYDNINNLKEKMKK